MNPKYGPLYFLIAWIAVVVFVAHWLPRYIMAMEFEHVRTVVKPVAVKPFAGDPTGSYIHSAAYYAYTQRED